MGERTLLSRLLRRLSLAGRGEPSGSDRETDREGSPGGKRETEGARSFPPTGRALLVFREELDGVGPFRHFFLFGDKLDALVGDRSCSLQIIPVFSVSLGICVLDSSADPLCYIPLSRPEMVYLRKGSYGP